MTMRTLLLGAAAGLVTVGAAQAADLPMEKAMDAVEYVKICSEFGTGFYYIPGTDTCLQVGGQVRLNFGYIEPQTRDENLLSIGGRAQITFDARTATELGTLRSFVALNALYDSEGTADFEVDKAYIQLGGLTAGYAASRYNFFDNYEIAPFLPYFSSAKTLAQLAYTAEFGGGFYVTGSLESNLARRSYYEDGVGDISDTYKDGDTAGQSMPDIVAAIGVNQGWGKAQVMGAIHQLRFGNNATGVDTAASTSTVAAENFPVPDTDYGYALGAGVLINLPFLAGGTLNLEGNYADGATSYTGLAFNSVVDTFAPYEAFVIDGDIETAQMWSLNGELGVNFTSQLSGTFLVSYADYDAPNDAYNFSRDNWQPDGNILSVGVSAAYVLVPGMTISGAVGYVSGELEANGGLGEDTTYDDEDPSGWIAGLRLQRSF